ncbi:TIGR01906 family membrane protein [Dehalobacter sp. DCM]|uniref:TIGR01906 family membrane protein n=1 Tax=Dehalobacter sp. DCM TaxID=2907827 RepID=UPI00308168BC|nr:TIGR01906 family membrane protein [Dehalobacter sp. DCM]
MTVSKLAAWFISIISAAVLMVVLLLTVIEQSAMDLDFYQSEYAKLDTAKEIGMSEQELQQTTVELLAYIQGERADLNIRAVINGQERPVFNQKEMTHMVDVQRLYTVSQTVRNLGMAGLLLLLILLRLLTRKEYWRFWARGYLLGAALFICVFGIIGFVISRDFLAFWNQFHAVIFTNDLWLLDPATDILIQMVPEQFFYDLVVRILTLFAGAIIAFIIPAAGIMTRRSVK